MDIRILEYFLTVAREGTFSAAADALHMTQPPLSREMKNLEHELGKTLFIRGKRKLVLTEEGRLLQARAQEVLELMDKVKKEIADNQKMISGDIYIGCAESVVMKMIASFIAKLNKENNQVRYHFMTGTAEILVEQLVKGIADICIFVGNTNINFFEHITLPSKDIYGLLIRQEHPLASKANITKKDLRNLPLFVPRQMLKYQILEDWLGVKTDLLNIIGTYDNTYTTSIMVDSGMGAALMLFPLHGVPNGECVFRPLFPRLEAPMNIAWKANRPLSDASAWFLEKLKEELEEHPTNYILEESVEWARLLDIEQKRV